MTASVKSHTDLLSTRLNIMRSHSPPVRWNRQEAGFRGTFVSLIPLAVWASSAPSAPRCKWLKPHPECHSHSETPGLGHPKSSSIPRAPHPLSPCTPSQSPGKAETHLEKETHLLGCGLRDSSPIPHLPWAREYVLSLESMILIGALIWITSVPPRLSPCL